MVQAVGRSERGDEMIKVETKGSRIAVSIDYDANNIEDFMEEFTAIIRSVRDSLSNDINEEFADMMIQTCGKVAYADCEEDINKALLELDDFMESEISKMAAQN